MTAHTPGPWACTKYESVVGPDGRDIRFRSLVTLCAGSDEEMDRAKANTRLISAAPDLLAIAEECFFFGILADFIEEKSPRAAARLRIIDRMAKDAIAKAKGGA